MTFSAIGWNVRVVQSPEHVREALNTMIDTYQPDAFALFEASRLAGHLDNLGYQVIHARKRPHGNPEPTDTALLVRSGLPIRGRRYLRMTLPWKGPLEGRTHRPRESRWTRIRLDEVWWKFGGSHGPFGQPQKREYVAKLIGWFLATASGRPTVMLDDSNIPEAVIRERLKIHPDIHIAGNHHIDLAQFRNCRLVASAQLDQYGSDHHAMHYRFEEDGRLTRPLRSPRP